MSRGAGMPSGAAIGWGSWFISGSLAIYFRQEDASDRPMALVDDLEVAADAKLAFMTLAQDRARRTPSRYESYPQIGKLPRLRPDELRARARGVAEIIVGHTRKKALQSRRLPVLIYITTILNSLLMQALRGGKT